MKSHEFFSSEFWTKGYQNKLKDHISVGIGECRISRMKASGVPMPVRLSARLDSLRNIIHEELDELALKIGSVSEVLRNVKQSYQV